MSSKDSIIGFSADEIWIESFDFNEQCEYFIGAYSRLEEDFLEYLEFVPCREENLHVSSQRLADFILRIPPLLAISFRLLTFGPVMKEAYYRWNIKISTDEKEFKKHVNIFESICMKKENNKDNLNDYYEIHELNLFEMWHNVTLSNKSLELDDVIGKIEFLEPIYPFERDKWFSWKDARNKIEHRGRMEASLENVLYGLGFLIILLEKLFTWEEPPFKFRSDLFSIGW